MTYDLDDDLDGLFDGPPIEKADIAVGLALAEAQQFKMHEEKCGKCRGTGRFTSYTGRMLGDCFACKGKGKLYFRTSIAERAKNREQVAARKERTVDNWAEAHPVEAAWIAEAAPRFEFAASMRDALRKYGHLTPGQLAACTRAAEASAARKAAWAAERIVKVDNAPAIDTKPIEDAFAVARDNGLKRLSLRLDEFKFKPAKSGGQNDGAIFVTSLVDTDRDGEALYLGKIANGKFMAGRNCPVEITDRVVAAAADPKGAAIAYGKRTGSCCICARELTNAVSIDLGIGPICAEKWGF